MQACLCSAHPLCAGMRVSSTWLQRWALTWSPRASCCMCLIPAGVCTVASAAKHAPAPLEAGGEGAVAAHRKSSQLHTRLPSTVSGMPIIVVMCVPYVSSGDCLHAAISNSRMSRPYMRTLMRMLPARSLSQCWGSCQGRPGCRPHWSILKQRSPAETRFLNIFIDLGIPKQHSGAARQGSHQHSLQRLLCSRCPRSSCKSSRCCWW